MNTQPLRLTPNIVPVWRSYAVESGVVVNQSLAARERPCAVLTPSDHPELPQVLANVHSEKDALAFVHRYGLLGHDEMAPPEQQRGGDPLDWLMSHVATVRLLLELTMMMNRQDVEGLERCLNVGGRFRATGFDPQVVEYFGDGAAFVQYAVRCDISPPVGIGVAGRDILTLARDVRRRVVNENICCAYPFLHEVDGQSILAYGFHALVEAVYLQVAREESRR